jgi:hypothetical protein
LFSKNHFPFLGLIVLVFFASTAQAQTKLLRFPDISGDRVVFTFGRRPPAAAPQLI